eukprot:jgi/Ulvmu1/8335/UM042_0041.1
MLSPNGSSRLSRRQLVCVISLAVVLVGCVVVSVAFLPTYWYMIADALPPSLINPTSIRGFSAVSVNSTGMPSTAPIACRLPQASAPSERSLCTDEVHANVSKSKHTTLEPVNHTLGEVSIVLSDGSHANADMPGTPADSDNSAGTEDRQVQNKVDIRAETRLTGHGVAVRDHWHQRHPQDIQDDQILDDQYLLSRDSMHELADQDGYIMVTWANNHYFEFVSNWVQHVEELGISAFVVGAMDKLILGRLLRAGIPCFAMQSGLSPDDFGWGSAQFHAMGRKKIKLVHLFTQMNLTVIISDVDTVWMRNPFEYFKRYPEADILTSSDYLAWTHGDEGLEDARKAGSAYNIGIMMFSPKSVAFAAEWVEWIERDDTIWDQNAFNDLAKSGMQFPDPESDLGQKRLFLGHNGNLVVGVLPVSIFASGHTFFVTRMHEQLGLEPYVVHATFQFSGTPGKRNRMREALLWKDGPEYVDPGHGFVAWEMDVPEALLAAGPPREPTVQCCEQQQGHFDLINHQLLQVRNGLAIASVLRLGIVIPQFIAGQDRYWAPHAGVLPGSATTLPYKAPLDHILDLERHLGHSKPEDEFGPDIPFREHSFLSNPALPAAVQNSQITVNLCPEAGGEHCCDGSAAAAEHEGALWIMPGLDDEQLRIALGPAVRKYKVLRFAEMAGVFSRHRSDADHERFVRRTTPMASLWCCVTPPPEQPGHVWYDLWWDVVPHTDQHGREWSSAWNITLGP